MDGEGGWHRGEGAIELVKRNASEVGREGAMGGSSWEVLRMLFQTLLRDFQQVDTLSSYVLHVNFEDVLFSGSVTFLSSLFGTSQRGNPQAGKACCDSLVSASTSPTESHGQSRSECLCMQCGGVAEIALQASFQSEGRQSTQVQGGHGGQMH